MLYSILQAASLTLNHMNYIYFLIVEVILDLNVERILDVVVLPHLFPREVSLPPHIFSLCSSMSVL